MPNHLILPDLRQATGIPFIDSPRQINDEEVPSYDGETERRHMTVVADGTIDEILVKLGPSAMGIYIALARRVNKDGRCHPSYDTLAEAAKISRRHIIRIMQELTAAGYVVIEPRADHGFNLSNVFYLPCHSCTYRSDMSGDIGSDTTGARVSPKVVISTTEVSNGYISNTAVSPNGHKPAAYSVEFETFWRSYPKGHGNKKKTYEQWRKLKPDAAMQAAMLDGVAAWKRSDRWRRGFIKDAAIWVRDRWWEDAPPDSGTDADDTPNAGGRMRPVL